jgi:hypothetical protein
MPDFILPLGPFHLVLLHLPIGGICAIWCVLLGRKNNAALNCYTALGPLHLFLMFSTLLTILLGLVYEVQGQYAQELEVHKLWGYIFGVILVLNYVLFRFYRKYGGRLLHYSYLLSLAAASFSLTVAGHQGGELVHGKGFLSKPFKTPLLKAQSAGHLPPATSFQARSQSSTGHATATVATLTIDQVQANQHLNQVPFDPMHDLARKEPASELVTSLTATEPAVISQSMELYQSAQFVLKKHCYSCHGATKQKGELRLDSLGFAKAAGQSGKLAIVAYDAAASLLIQRMQLVREHDDAMPPSNKAAVSAEDLAQLIAWIEAGAVWPEQISRSPSSRGLASLGDDAASQKWIQDLNATGAKAEYNSWDDRRIRVDLAYIDVKQLENTLQQLKLVADQIIWLDLSSLQLSKAFFEQLPKFKNLERLHLDGSNVSDAELQLLVSLSKLNYLNLFDTQITDQSLAQLKQFPSLQKIFLAQSKVTKSGAGSLAQQRPDLQVIHR